MLEKFGGYNPEAKKPYNNVLKKALVIDMAVGALEGCAADKKHFNDSSNEFFGEQQNGTDENSAIGECIYRQEDELNAGNVSSLQGELKLEVRGNARMSAELARITISEAAVYYAVQYSASTRGLEKKFDRILHDEEYRVRVNSLIKKYCKEFNVPSDIAYGVAALESGFDMEAQSGVGAKGIYQMMDNTSSDARLQLPGADAMEQNIYSGIKYLSILYERYGQWSIAMMAYSTGPKSLSDKLRDKAQCDYESEYGNDQSHWREFLEKHNINGVTLYSNKYYGLGGIHPFQYPFDEDAIRKLANDIANGTLRAGELTDLVSPEDFRKACLRYPNLKTRIINKAGASRAQEIFRRLKIK